MKWIMNSAAVDRKRGPAWFSVKLTGTVPDDSDAQEALRNTDTATSVSLNLKDSPFTPEDAGAVAFSFGFVKPTRPSVPNDQTLRITARQATPRDDRRRIPWGPGQSVFANTNLPYPVEPNEQPAPEPTDPPARKVVYLTMNTLQITDVATNTPLAIQDVTIGLDIDSLSWTFGGTLSHICHPSPRIHSNSTLTH